MRINLLKRALNRYGDTVILIHNGERTEMKALTRPLLEQERLEIATPLGMNRREKYLYFGLPETAIEVGDLMQIRDACYEVQTARAIFAGSKMSHWWGVLLYCGKEASS